MDATTSTGEPRAAISREALLHNAQFIRRIVGTAKICAVIKADAYGHGAVLVAEALCSGEKPAVDLLAVGSIDEAAALPAQPLPLIVLRPVENALGGGQRSRIKHAIDSGWMLTLCSSSAADDVARIALSCRRQAMVQVMIDTAMCREGASIESLNGLLKTIKSHPSLRLAGLCTHFACADDISDPLTGRQMRQFRAAIDTHVRQAGKNGHPPLRHAANSGGIFFLPVSHLDMVRVGIAMYGIDPTGRPSKERPLRPVMKWTAPLIGIREVKRGAAVGYGQTWRAERDTRIGLVPVGYADGYQRCFSNRGVMLAGEKPAPVIGRVSMDLTTIDLTAAPESRIGDEVVVMDDNPASPASVYELARWADTIPYEIVCRIGPRVHRVLHRPPTPTAGGQRPRETPATR